MVIPGATNATTTLNAVTDAAAGTYTVTVSNASGSSVASVDVTVKPFAAPVIATQPRAAVVQVAQPVTFSYVATGSFPRTQQWRKDGNTITGATDAVYSIAAATVADAGNYSVVVTNALGSATTLAASLTVNAATAPVISPSFPYDVSASVGSQTTLSVSFNAGSSPFTYQWLKAGAPIPGATNATLAFAALALTDAGKYSVTVSNAAGTATSREAVLTVTAATPVTFYSSPSNQTVFQGQSIYLSVGVNGSSPVTFQWQKNGTAIAGATNSSYSIASTVVADSGSYNVVATNAAGSVTSNAATVTVNPPVAPTITTQPAGQSLAYGNSINLSVQATGSPTLMYQWNKDGVAIAGGTYSSYSLSPATPANNGIYTVTVTNPVGAVTSSGVNVTVAAAVAPTITAQPSSSVISYGGSVSLNVQVTGSPTLSFVWKKDGVPLNNSGSSNFYINSATPADAGVYTVTISNSAGSVTSGGATITVASAVAPTITSQPTGGTIPFYNTLSLSVQAAGTPSLTYLWKKDGVPLSNANSSFLTIGSTTPANSGVYTVTITNSVGSVTSVGVTVTVSPAVVPSINGAPTAQTVATGQSASFSVSVNSSGTGPLTFQWLKNGGAIVGATSSGLAINNVKDADAASYSAVVTGAGGSVTSPGAKLSVVPPAGPVVTAAIGITNSLSNPVALGTSVTLGWSYFGSVTGAAPLTYQWAKGGIPIPGATSATYVIASVAAGDIGTYTLTVANEGGIATTTPFVLLLGQTQYYGLTPSAAPWLDIGRVGNTVYFLATVPARIERYDLAAEQWLPTTVLSDTLVPTAFFPAAEGVYIAYGRSLVRRALDLTGEVPLTNAAANITLMFATSKFLYYNVGTSAGGSVYPTFGIWDRTAGQPGPAISTSSGAITYRQITVVQSLNKAFAEVVGSSPGSFETFGLGSDGKVTGYGSSPYFSTFPGGSRMVVFPGDQLVADTSGTVYRAADSVYAGSFGHAFSDLTFLDDGTPVVLRDVQLSITRPTYFTEVSRATIPQMGYRVFARGNNLYVFGGTAAGSPYTVTKVSTAGFAPVALPPASVPAGRFSVNDAFLGANNVVYVYSRSLQSLVRWDPATRGFLPSVPLRDAPNIIAWQPGASRAVAVYPDGALSQIPLTAGATEQVFGAVNLSVRAMVDLGDAVLLNAADAQSSGDERLIVSYSNSQKLLNSSTYNPIGQAWQPTSRRLYSLPQFNGSLQYEVFTAADAPAGGTGNSGSITTSVTPPIRFNADGSLLVTMNGRVLNADLASVGTLANNIVDGAWLDNVLYTIVANAGQTTVQQWSRTTYLQSAVATLPGTPVRIFATSDSKLVVVSSAQGFLTINLLNPDLTINQLPNIQSYAGSYFAKASGGGATGDVALYLRGDGTAALLATVPSTHTALWAGSVTLNADGSFVAVARDLASGADHTVAGTVTAGGAVSGAIPGLNLTFSGSRTAGLTAPGYYQAPSVNGAAGAAYAIFGADGRMLIVGQNATNSDGAVGTTDASGVATVTTPAGTKLVATVNGGLNNLSVTATSGALGGMTFFGLADGVARTDRLANISTRGSAGTGENALTAGFVVAGSGPRTVLIRAVGPPLAGFGVTGAMADPQLALFRGATQLAQSNDWSAEAGASNVAAAAASVGAFALPSPGKDAAMVATIDPNAYTVQVTPATGEGGVALVEVYDAGGGASGTQPRLVNISTRGLVGTGDSQLIAGIIVGGNAPKRLLIRAVGPALAAFGLTTALADPVLTINAGSTTIGANDDWGGQTNGTTATDVAVASASVGAFALPIGSRDASVIITLQPGSYSAVVSGKAGTTGIALVEVYELPN